jgi:hypothetical protein
MSAVLTVAYAGDVIPLSGIQIRDVLVPVVAVGEGSEFWAQTIGPHNTVWDVTKCS